MLREYQALVETVDVWHTVVLIRCFSVTKQERGALSTFHACNVAVACLCRQVLSPLSSLCAIKNGVVRYSESISQKNCKRFSHKIYLRHAYQKINHQ